MPNDYFRFKQFTIRQERCAMKVGTDGVLLGAWTEHAGALRILDIGTGTGVLALIAAQRNPTAMIDAVEIDADAAQQARENAAASPWPGRIRVFHADVRRWDRAGRYDLVLCNPPFYKGHQTSNDVRKATAKHEVELGLDQLVQEADRFCIPNGRVSMILPIERLAEVQTIAAGHGFALLRMCKVCYVATKKPKRVLVELSRSLHPELAPMELAVERVRGEFTPEYRAMLSDLELHF